MAHVTLFYLKHSNKRAQIWPGCYLGQGYFSHIKKEQRIDRIPKAKSDFFTCLRAMSQPHRKVLGQYEKMDQK